MVVPISLSPTMDYQLLTGKMTLLLGCFNVAENEQAL